MEDILDKVKKLQENRIKLRELCGEIVSTLIINNDRKVFDCIDSEAKNNFDELIEGWRTRFNKLNAA